MSDEAHGAAPVDVGGTAPATPQPSTISEASEGQPHESGQANEGTHENLAKLAEKDDVTEYAEASDDAKDDALEEEGREEEIPQHRKKTRNQRDKEAKQKLWERAEAAEAEARALRESGVGVPPEAIESIQAKAMFRARAEQVKESIPDFDAVLQSAPQVDLHDVAIATIANSKLGPRMAYELASAPDALTAISRMPPQEQLRVLGRLEFAIEEQARAQANGRRVSNAPAPIKPPSGGGVSPPSDIRKLAESDDISGYAKARDKQSRSR